MSKESKALVRELLEAYEAWNYRTEDEDRARFIKAQKELMRFIEELERQAKRNEDSSSESTYKRLSKDEVERLVQLVRGK